jgi:hypothetical protein
MCVTMEAKCSVKNTKCHLEEEVGGLMNIGDVVVTMSKFSCVSGRVHFAGNCLALGLWK